MDLKPVNNWTNILWIVLIIVVIIIIYNNFCNRQNVENFNNLYQNTQLQKNLAYSQDAINYNLKKIIQNDNKIKTNISNLSKINEGYQVPNLQECSYKTINGFNDEDIKYPIKNNLIGDTTNIVPDAHLPEPQSNMCSQGVELKPYGYSFGDNQQEDNEFLNWINDSKTSSPSNGN
jgi:hypothetical protein